MKGLSITLKSDSIGITVSYTIVHTQLDVIVIELLANSSVVYTKTITKVNDASHVINEFPAYYGAHQFSAIAKSHGVSSARPSVYNVTRGLLYMLIRISIVCTFVSSAPCKLVFLPMYSEL